MFKKLLLFGGLVLVAVMLLLQAFGYRWAGVVAVIAMFGCIAVYVARMTPGSGRAARGRMWTAGGSASTSNYYPPDGGGHHGHHGCGGGHHGCGGGSGCGGGGGGCGGGSS